MATLAEIRAFCQRIAQVYHPRRIILFGSHARGEAGADSDVDLLVVMPHEGSGWRKAADIRQHVHPTFALDLLVRSPEELQQRLAIGDYFMLDIVERGRALYEALDD